MSTPPVIQVEAMKPYGWKIRISTDKTRPGFAWQRKAKTPAELRLRLEQAAEFRRAMIRRTAERIAGHKL